MDFLIIIPGFRHVGLETRGVIVRASEIETFKKLVPVSCHMVNGDQTMMEKEFRDWSKLSQIVKIRMRAKHKIAHGATLDCCIQPTSNNLGICDRTFTI